MKALCLIIALSVIHFALSLWALCCSLGNVLGGSESTKPPNLSEKISDVASDILCSPCMQIAAALHMQGEGVLGKCLPLVNSLLWGVFLYAAFRGCYSLLRSQHKKLNSLNKELSVKD
jgi:hypothetical protein